MKVNIWMRWLLWQSLHFLWEI